MSWVFFVDGSNEISRNRGIEFEIERSGQSMGVLETHCIAQHYDITPDIQPATDSLKKSLSRLRFHRT
ncbi:MAG: hypothetical protein I8H94_01800 [Rhodobacteraceae bacterium]|nr:hypothetical protein [Paracoccaceae bacterium]